MEEKVVLGNTLTILKAKKDRAEREIIKSFIIHLILAELEVLAMTFILSFVDYSNILKTIFVLVIVAIIGGLLYLTSISFIDKVESEMLRFWHCIKILIGQKKTEKELNFVGELTFTSGEEKTLKEILEK